MPVKRAIEEYFPIVEVNRLAVPERNAFKPIYTMHKWFARRSSSVFRAILLGAMKPAGTDIMKEFYRDHTDDPDTKGKTVLDPFMGGGTTVVEALRLGCKVTGIDLNPVAWFIVKTEVEPVDLDELKAAFERLAERKVGWSAKPLKETLLSLYKTECPACGNKDADIIYTFWVKSAPCTTATCNHQTPLFSDFVISQKSPSIRYLPDCVCPKCKKKFDWEIEPAAMVGDPRLMVNAAKFSAGEGRSSARWSYSDGSTVACPWCKDKVAPQVSSPKTQKKKVPLSVNYCPACEEVWQFRGELEEKISCPSCKNEYNPKEGNLPESGKFICRGNCNGNVDAVISAIRKLPETERLPVKPYALEGYCSHCDREEKGDDSQAGLFDKNSKASNKGVRNEISTMLRKNSGKFIKRISSGDFSLFKKASEIWERENDKLLYPKSEIPEGAETHRLLEHHYLYWHQMFNNRQLLALSSLIKGIDKEESQTMKEMLLSAFFNTLNNMSDFTSYRPTVGAARQVFARHDFQPKMTPCEVNPWGIHVGMGSFQSMFDSVFEGKKFNKNVYDRKIVFGSNKADGFEIKKVASGEKVLGTKEAVTLYCNSSTNLGKLALLDIVISDPPYSGNVNYSELADYFYVWLRLILKNKYPHFSAEQTPKVEEVVENRARQKTAKDFEAGLMKVFEECNRISKDDSLLIFTFHHAEGSAWEALLNAVCEAGYCIEAVYPIHGEAESSLHLQENEAISYDLIHVCRKRQKNENATKKAWATIRQEIRKRANDEARLIETGRYGNEPLSPADINILLIGKCLEMYSKHYGTIIDHLDQPVPLKRALEEIKLLIDQLVTKEQPLPSELEDIDAPSYIYLTTLCDRKEITGDEISKNTKGIIETSDLKDYGLIIKGREKRGRTFEVKQPIERLNELKEKFNKVVFVSQPTLEGIEVAKEVKEDFRFVDYLHLLLGLADAGDNLLPYLEKFRGLRPQIRASMEYLSKKNKNFAAPAGKVLALLDERTLFTKKEK